MPVNNSSRAAGRTLLAVETKRGELRNVLTLPLAPSEVPEAVLHHTVVQGETIDSLAHRYYNDERLAWRILDANPLVFPLDIAPGDTLLVPRIAAPTVAIRSRRFE